MKCHTSLISFHGCDLLQKAGKGREGAREDECFECGSVLQLKGRAHWIGYYFPEEAGKGREGAREDECFECDSVLQLKGRAHWIGYYLLQEAG